MHIVTEKYIPSVFETLKEFRTILLGQIFRIYTDNKNFICNSFNTDRVLRWRLILEDYGTDIEYMQGDKNIVADALSRFPINGNQDTTQESTYTK